MTPSCQPDDPPRVAVCIDSREGAGRHRLRGVVAFARRVNWRLHIVRRPGTEGARELRRWRGQGIIAFQASDRLAALARRRGIPLVDTAEAPAGRRPTNVACLNEDAVGRLAAGHFISLGLRDFAYCGVADNVVSDHREASFARVVPAEASPATFTDRHHDGHQAMGPLMRWLSRLPRPTGLLAFDDLLGERVITACRWAGIDVPHEIAVLGIGHDELMCELCDPPLSSIRIGGDRIGYAAGEMLQELLALSRPDRQPSIRRIEPLDVWPRGSTDLVAVDDEMVAAALRHIRDSAPAAIGVDHVAQAVGAARRTLERRFANAMGRTVHAELSAVRMQRARDLLVTTEATIETIARDCGFSSGASFARAFVAHTGQSPSEFRRRLRPL